MVVHRFMFRDFREDFGENEEQVFQYYTVVDPTLLPIEQDENFGLLQDDGKSVLFLTFGKDEECEEAKTEDTAQDSSAAEEEEQPSFLSNLKLITLEDGRMFVTATNDQESVKYIEPEFVSKNEDVNNLESQHEDQMSGSNEYQEIELEDGTRAIVDIAVWNNLFQNVNCAHNIKTEKKYECSYDGCGKFYTTSYHLAVHMRSHTGNRPYQCEVAGCDKAFATGYSLKAHIRTHTGEKPYGCTRCDKHFKTSGDLQKHIRTHTGEKPFQCPIKGCGRSFTTSNIRKVHIRSHTGERPYNCDYVDCGKAFASATNYRNHMRIHSGEKPYVCSFDGCGKRFTEYSSLYKHNTVHQSFKPFRCNICGQQCKQESTLNTHKRTIHKVIDADDPEVTLSEQSSSVDEIVLEMDKNNDSTYLCSEEEIDEDPLNNAEIGFT